MSDTVIVGAGIIGCATAYYLSRLEPNKAGSIHLIESSEELFRGASGFAGGFLAEDWFAPSVAELAALSFKLHKGLAREFNGREKWGYSKSTATSLHAENPHTQSIRGDDWLRAGTSRITAANVAVGGSDLEIPRWLAKSPGHSVEVTTTDGVAQVDPKKLCRFLLSKCIERGVNLYYPAKPTSITQDSDGYISSINVVRADGTDISTLAGHSLVVRSPRWRAVDEFNGCHAVFATDSFGGGFAPEIFGRIGEEIYLAGLNTSDLPLPDTSDGAVPLEPDLIKLRQVAVALLGGSDGQNDLEVVRESLCFRPVTPNGRPIISRIKDTQLGNGIKTRGEGRGGVYIATGHGPWGISMSLGTGLILSELVLGKAPSADISELALK